ncbi:5-oxoprolinase subunit B family protein [Mangrovibacter yixingensis]|uniref:5-oxoprolinase subunit B family protein n=1 Tax=Mangrovibacter yixingensis TaxID=1529639 RepID=UPI001CFAD36B|nr:allophanate hydrolase subunit 1 [Mangrovibacter yixingensis]
MANNPIRYSFGGDEHLFAEIDREMSLKAFFRGLKLTRALEACQLPGVLDICLANASFQVRFNPDVLAPHVLLAQLQVLEAGNDGEDTLETRIIEVPVFYNDPWTHETLMRFRDRHQEPGGSDLDYAAHINGYTDSEAFIAAHSNTPWFVSMVGFVSGLPFMYQMVEREKQLQVPKYLRPRTDTPGLSLGHGGCFGCIYSVRGAGGYQLFGITPMPIYDPAQRLAYLKPDMVFFKAGDIVQFRPVDRAEYDTLCSQVQNGDFAPRIRKVTFALADFLNDPQGYPQQLKRGLYDH